MPRTKSQSKKTKNGFLQKTHTVSRFRLVIFALAFAVVGVVAASFSLAATKTVTYSGKLTPGSPSKSYAFTAEAGSSKFKVNFEKSSRGIYTLKLKAADGSVVAQKSSRRGDKSLTLSRDIAAGNYTLEVSARRLRESNNYKVQLSYTVKEVTAPKVAIAEPTADATVGGVFWALAVRQARVLASARLKFRLTMVSL